MKKFISTAFFFIVLISPVLTNAQLNHFIYLQTEGKQPFYAKLDKKILSSSVSGYLIIPKLKDGAYTITIGFPKKEADEQVFVCNVSNKDAGYLLKNFGDKGWGLFNLQTLDVVMAGNLNKEKEVAKTEKSDAFSNMLSDVVNDPSIRQVEKQKVETKQGLVKNEEKAPEPKVAEPAISESKPQVAVAPTLNTSILKKQTVTGKSGTEIIYIDIYGSTHDTISILIPLEKTVEKAVEEGNATTPGEIVAAPVVEKEKPAVLEIQKQSEPEKDTSVIAKEEVNHIAGEQPPVKTEKQAEDKKFLPIEVAPSGKPVSVLEQPANTPMINSDCKSYAGDEDFLKLRKKMAAAENDDDMIAAAQKSFKTKCYTTDQVKNLSVLFLKDSGKYRFFDLAYQYVSDSHNFGLLENQLTESYYISRFKAMIRH